MSVTYYVKSLDSDNTTKTLQGDKKIICQSLFDILNTKTIQANTLSFGQKKRLSTTILHDNYLKTYRPQGIIFKTDGAPDYVLPFDLILLSETDNIVVHYYQMKDNLHQFYNHTLHALTRWLSGRWPSLVAVRIDPHKAAIARRRCAPFPPSGSPFATIKRVPG